jgi:endonuclease YncB( thermonuclease family)
MRVLAALLATVLLLVCAQAQPAKELTGRVVGITDGDTLTLLTEAHQQIRVRLAEIDAPESGQPWGRIAKQAPLKLGLCQDREGDDTRHGSLRSNAW